MRGIAALVAAALFLLAPTSLLQATDAQVNEGAVSGTVCTADGLVQYANVSAGQPTCMNHPIPGAKVHFQKTGVVGDVGAVGETVETGDKGQFDMKLPAGDYTVTVTRLGFADAHGEHTVESGVAKRLDLGMSGKDVSGKGLVTNQDGTPLRDVPVSVAGSETRTDMQGIFPYSAVAGYHVITAYLGGYQEGRGEFLLDGQSPVTLVLWSEGAPPKLDAVIQGTVRDQHGNAVPGVTIHVYSSGGGGGCGPDYCYDYACPMPASDQSTSDSDPAGTEPAPMSPMACGRPMYYGGESKVTTGSDGRYKMSVAGGTWHSMSIYQEGYASWYDGRQVDSGQTVTVDIELMKFPEKTAQLVGRITDLNTGKGLRLVSLNMNWPEFGVSECSDNGVGYPYPEPMPMDETDPDHETNTVSGENSGTATATSHAGTTTTVYASDGKMAVMPYPGGYVSECRIKINDDGTFSATVTPGYAMFNAYYEIYKDCPYDSTGMQGTCGPDYFAWSGVLVLAESGETRLDIALPPKPAPDATLAGYIVDGAPKKAIPNAYVSMWNMDNNAGGQAQTDTDGSYKVALRTGYHSVQVYVEGFLPWQATVFVKAGDNQFDIVLTAGSTNYGGGCYGCVMESKRAEDGSTAAGAMPPASPMGPGTTTSVQPSNTGAAGDGDDSGSQSGTKDQAFADLGGGLGPYDAEKRSQVEQAGDGSKASPHIELAVMVTLLAGLAFARRRRLT